MKRLDSNQSGVIFVILVFVVSLMVFGYVAINNIAKSREANQLKDSASEAVDTAEGIIKGN